MKIPPIKRYQGGFSLIELLTVVAIIGIIAGIAIPNLGSIGTASQAARDQRNAQSIVNMYQSGRAMGITWNGADRPAKINAVIAGQAPTTGVFAGNVARVPGIAGDALTGLYPYIGINGSGDLVYDQKGSQSPN